MEKQKYDIIGDIHGCHDKLLLLLTALDYKLVDGCYRHPLGRKAAFLGDFIDPKGSIPHDVPAVLEIVKAMVDQEEAVAVMGNHEFNAIAHATPDGNGGYMRPHLPDKDEGLKITIKAFKGGFDGQIWQDWIKWFKTLPLFIELDGFRLVHASWHEDDIANLKGKNLDHEFLKAATKKGTPEYGWIENVLKGDEIKMPAGSSFIDSTNIPRKHFRARWFERNPVGKSAKDLLFPAGSVDIPDEPVPDETAALIPGYSKTAPPAFFGHYFKPYTPLELKPELDNLACLDFSVAKGGPMVAYRWDGEAKLTPEKYLAV